MASVTFQIPSKQGTFMLWSWTTQSSNTFNVTLKDSATTYINNVARVSINPLPVNSGGSTVNGTNLALTINCAQASTLKCLTASDNLVDPALGAVSSTYTVVAEDASDNDYNDIWFTVIFWKSKG